MNDRNFLRPLAEAGPYEAPGRIEIALKEAFRRHHRARRLRRVMIAVIATGAAAACITAFVHVPEPVGRPGPIVFHPAPPPIAWVQAKPPALLFPTHIVPTHIFPTHISPSHMPPVHTPANRPRTDQLATTEFVPLPYGDDSLVEESATIVRVELPRSALRLAGFNVAQERANDRVQADVVLGADGLAHAVRFVKYLE